MKGSILRHGLLLGGFALAAALVLGGTELATRDRIRLNQQLAEERSLLAIIPRERHDNAMLAAPVAITDTALLGVAAAQSAYVARRNGALVAVIVPVVAPEGYGGPIRLLVGINDDGSIAGLRVVAHRETPGLGDRIEAERSDWSRQFIGRKLAGSFGATTRWGVRKNGGDFDQLTGATVTSRAVIDAARRALTWFEAHRASLATPRAGGWDHG